MTKTCDCKQPDIEEAKADALLEAADALDAIWDERRDKDGRDWADGVAEAEALIRERAAKHIKA